VRFLIVFLKRSEDAPPLIINSTTSHHYGVGRDSSSSSGEEEIERSTLPPSEQTPLFSPRRKLRTTSFTLSREDTVESTTLDEVRKGEWREIEISINKTEIDLPEPHGTGFFSFNWLPWKKKAKKMTEEELAESHKLGQWLATSIAGNDITSSCLYVAGISTIAAGKWAPLSLVLVAIMLYLFRSVYSEVGSALPMNGGSYTVLLNTTTKLVGSFAACLTMLSYTATAVVSAQSAMSYFHEGIYDGFPVYWGTIIILGIFAVLNLIGLSESANVAFGIFVFHMFTLTLLCATAFGYLVQDASVLKQNWHAPPIRSVPIDIFFGFCAGLLGVTGFETSANYIEEQKDGVFPKTLRNMWIAVAIFNPLIGFLTLSLIPIPEIIANSNYVLAEVGSVAAGSWLGTFVSVDATLVLCGSVLTSYVGVTGLVRRMTLDRCLPQFLLYKNPLTGTEPVIIIGFFAITSSLFFIVNGDVETLAGVYAIAFLSVMSLFAVGNILMKYKRDKLPRSIRANWLAVVLALASVVVGWIGNVIYNPDNIKYFSIYFSVTLSIVMVMFARIRLMKIILFFLASTKSLDKYIGNWIRREVKKINKQHVVFFAKTDDLELLNKAVLYVRENELTDRLKIVHIFQDESEIPPKLVTHVEILDEMYPKLRLDLITVKAEGFTPRVVKALAEKLQVPQNFMFISCPGEQFPDKIARYGGMRIITH
jgi:amino acid transporter